MEVVRVVNLRRDCSFMIETLVSFVDVDYICFSYFFHLALYHKHILMSLKYVK